MNSFLPKTVVFDNKEQGKPNCISLPSPAVTMGNILLWKTFFVQDTLSQILIVWDCTLYIYIMPIILTAKELVFFLKCKPFANT